MNTLRRETIIALRARHTAFRIAADILYPQQPPPAVAQPAIPIVEDGENARAEWEEELRRREARAERQKRHFRWTLASFAVLALAMCLWLMIYAIFLEKTLTAPPLPQGRPIRPAAAE